MGEGVDVALLTQFGTAGLIAAMWLVERRVGAARERQIEQAHEQLRSQHVTAGALLEVVRENTRAVAVLEATQRTHTQAILRLLQGRGGGQGLGGGHGQVGKG